MLLQNGLGLEAQCALPLGASAARRHRGAVDAMLLAPLMMLVQLVLDEQA